MGYVFFIEGLSVLNLSDSLGERATQNRCRPGFAGDAGYEGEEVSSNTNGHIGGSELGSWSSHEHLEHHT